MTPRNALRHVLAQPEYPGWEGDIRIERLASVSHNLARSFSFSDKRNAPVHCVPLGRLVTVQPNVDRKWVVHLLRNGWADPILVSTHPTDPHVFIIQDGHHRAYVAALLGMPCIRAKVVPFPPNPNARSYPW